MRDKPARLLTGEQGYLRLLNREDSESGIASWCTGEDAAPEATRNDELQCLLREFRRHIPINCAWRSGNIQERRLRLHAAQAQA